MAREAVSGRPGRRHVKVTAVVGEMLEREAIDIVGLGVAESRGIRRGIVVNLEAAVESIKKAIEEAELMAGVEIDTVHLALSGPHQRVQQPWRDCRGRKNRKSPGKMSGGRLMPPRPCRSRPDGRSYTSCHKTSSSTNRTESELRSA